jgi:hypothetical protein
MEFPSNLRNGHTLELTPFVHTILEEEVVEIYIGL